MLISLKIKKKNLLLILVAVLIGSINYLKRDSFGADFLAYESYYYTREFFVEPGYYFLQNSFSFVGLHFAIFWTALTTFAVYQVATYSNKSAPLILFYFVILPVLFFLILAGHTRSGFALGAICWSLNRGQSVTKALLIGGLFHIGSMVVFVICFFIKQDIKLIKKVIVAFLMALVSFLIIYFLSTILTDLGKGNYVKMFSFSYLASDHFQHRSLWALENLRMWFWISIVMYLLLFKVHDGILYISVALTYLIFSFDSYIAQKASLIFLPLTALVFMSRQKIRSIQHLVFRIAGIIIILSFGTIDIAERLNLTL